MSKGFKRFLAVPSEWWKMLHSEYLNMKKCKATKALNLRHIKGYKKAFNFKMMMIMTLRMELQNEVQNGSSLLLKDTILSSICSHWRKLTHRKIEVKDIIFSISSNIYRGLIKRLMLKHFLMQPNWKLNLSVRISNVQHQNGRLKSLCNINLDKTLTHQQLFLHFLFMKQFTLECFVLWRSVMYDEIVLLQKAISVVLHHKDLFRKDIFSPNIRIIIRMYLQNAHQKGSLKWEPQNNFANCHDLTVVTYFCFF